MKSFLQIFLCLITSLSYAQHFVMKSNGQHIPYKKIKSDENFVEITDDKKKKTRIDKDDIIGYYDGVLQRVTYKKPRVSMNQKPFLEPVKNDSVKGFKYLEREEVGKITLYKEVINSSYVSGGMTYGSSTTYYYAEKGDQFKNVFITGWNSKKDDLIDFKFFFNDDSETLRTIEGDDFHFNEKNMIGLIKEYNLKNFQKPGKEEYKALGSISFYTLAEAKVKQAIVLKVNDSIEYKLPATYYPLPINLPLNTPSKVCVIWETGSVCELVQPIQFASSYYQIRYFLDKSFGLEKKNYREFKNYLLNERPN